MFTLFILVKNKKYKTNSFVSRKVKTDLICLLKFVKIRDWKNTPDTKLSKILIHHHQHRITCTVIVSVEVEI